MKAFRQRVMALALSAAVIMAGAGVVLSHCLCYDTYHPVIETAYDDCCDDNDDDGCEEILLVRGAPSWLQTLIQLLPQASLIDLLPDMSLQPAIALTVRIDREWRYHTAFRPRPPSSRSLLALNATLLI